MVAAHLLLRERGQASLRLPAARRSTRDSYAARRLLLPLALDDEVLAQLLAIEQARADRRAGAPEPGARHEQRGERQRLEADRAGEPERGIEVGARGVDLRELRRELALGAPHVGPPAKRLGGHAERGRQSAPPGWERARRQFLVERGRRATEQHGQRVHGLRAV